MILLLEICTVMEAACGEYGDMVPPLVVAVQNNQCELYQCQQKITNCDKPTTTVSPSNMYLLFKNCWLYSTFIY